MKLGFKEKAAYGIGAVGKDMVYMLSASYILYYYQDIMGVSAWVMGIILMAARVFDAFNDPLMGAIVAGTKTKWGKFRPWLFIGTLTNAIILFFMFAAPPALNGKGMIAYAAIFYVLWGITYTMMDIPYWSMVPAFTENGKEREAMSALGRTCAGVGSAIITIVTILSVNAIGNMAVGKNQNVENVRLETATVYVAELDETGATTGNIKELTGGGDMVISADKSELSGEVSYTQSNSKYTLSFTNGSENVPIGENGELNEENSRMDIALNPADKTGVICVYLPTEEYNAVNEIHAVMLDLSSTKEVDRLGFKYFSLIVAILFFVFILITCIFIKEKSTVDVKSAKIGDMFKALLQNDQAMAMVVTIVLVNSAIYITSNLLIYFFKYDLGGRGWQGNYTLFSTFGGGMQILAMCIFFPILRKFFNMIKIFYISVFSAIGGYGVLLVMALTGVNSVYPFFVPGFFIFSAVGILNVLVTVFLANTVDYGEIKNNRRDESVIFSMQTFVVKLASGIATLVAAGSLSLFQISRSETTYEAVDGSLMAGLKAYIASIAENGAITVSGSSVLGLRFVMTVLPIFVLIVGFIVFKTKYILTDEKLEEISAQIKERRAAEAVAE